MNRLNSFRGYLAACLRSWGVADQDIDDWVQETITQACLAAEQFGGYEGLQDAQLRSLLARIARNTYLNWCRREARRPEVEGRYATVKSRMMAEGGGSAVAERAVDTADWLEAAIRRLSLRQQYILRLRYCGDWKYSSIAAELGVSVGRVKQIEAAALRCLRVL